MEDAENKQQIEVTIEVCNNNGGQVNDSLPNINVSKTLLSPILTSVHAGYFRMSIAFGAQALLWKILVLPTNDHSQPIHHQFHKLPSTAFFSLWCLALLLLFLLSFLYILRCFFHFHLVRTEFLHNIGVNYLYAPWISWLLLLQSAPMIIPNTLPYQVLWWVFTVPVFLLDLKIYGQWFTTEKRFLSMVANPTSQISVIGNLLGARAAAETGWKESAVFMFSLGMAHYLVLFVTLYQRLAGGSRFPATMRPAFFLFSAAPSLASLAWSSISGTFDAPSKMLFFLSFFLFISLACRPALFKKSLRRFTVVWWAYSFPLTFVALASVEYAQKAKGPIASGLMLLLSVFSVLVFFGLMMLTAVNADKLFTQKGSTPELY